jgi:oligoribonuclease
MAKLAWIDLEMTGLDDKTDSILEVALLITDMDFNEVETLHRVVYQPQSVLDGMDDWCKEHHGKSGLTALVPKGTPIAQVESEMIAVLDRHFGKDERVVLCGNSVGNDRRFIDNYLKEFSKRLHYRLIDVSSFKEIYRQKYGVKYEKNNAHRATGDIQESIAELKHYLSFVKIP